MTMDMTTEMTTEEKKLPGYLLDAPKNAPAHMAALHKWKDFPSHFSRPPPQGPPTAHGGAS